MIIQSFQTHCENSSRQTLEHLCLCLRALGRVDQATIDEVCNFASHTCTKILEKFESDGGLVVTVWPVVLTPQQTCPSYALTSCLNEIVDELDDSTLLSIQSEMAGIGLSDNTLQDEVDNRGL